MSGPGKGEKRGYSWPPFEDGHTKSTVHGARSPRRVAPVAAEIERELLADEATPDHLRRPEFRSAVSAWARAEAICRVMWDWLAEQDVEDALTDVTRTAETEEASKGRTTRRSISRRVVSVLEQLRRYEAHAAALRRELGLSPLAAGRLAKDLSASRWYQSARPLDKALDAIEQERRKAIEDGGGGG